MHTAIVVHIVVVGHIAAIVRIVVIAIERIAVVCVMPSFDAGSFVHDDFG